MARLMRWCRRAGRRGFIRGVSGSCLKSAATAGGLGESSPSRDAPDLCNAGAGRPEDSGSRVNSLRADLGFSVIWRQAQRRAERISEFPAAGITIFRRLSQRPRQDAVDRRWKLRPPGRQRRRQLRHMRPDHRPGVFTRERRRAAEQLECRAGQRVLVGPPINRLAPDLLRRRVSRQCPGTAPIRSARSRTAPLCSARNPTGIRDRQARPRIHQHVRRLDITMHQPGAVRGVQRRRYPGDDRRRAPR